MPNPNNCDTCSHRISRSDEDGFCYMFKDEPSEQCMQHSGQTDFERTFAAIFFSGKAPNPRGLREMSTLFQE